MRPLALILCVLASPMHAGQIEAPVSGEFKPGGQSGSIGSSLNAPTPLSLSVPALSLAPSLGAAPTPAPVGLQAVPVQAAAAKPVAAAAVTAAPGLPDSRLPAGSVRAPALKTGLSPAASTDEKKPESGYEEGRVLFDQDASRPGAESSPVSGGTWSRLRSSLAPGAASRGAAAVQTPRADISVKQRLTETADIGVFALGLQILSGIVFLVAGAHAAYPLLAGALWALGGSEMIKYLGSLRSVIVGGWQASHDQKMRTDYATGKLKDIRGHKYGEDRYDIHRPGPVSARERAVIDAAAVLFGLPWVIGGGAYAVGGYLLSAAAALYLRRLWQRSRPQPQTATAADANFERDR